MSRGNKKAKNAGEVEVSMRLDALNHQRREPFFRAKNGKVWGSGQCFLSLRRVKLEGAFQKLLSQIMRARLTIANFSQFIAVSAPMAF